MKTIATDEAKAMHKNAVQFERKLIAEWLLFSLPEKDRQAILSGEYKTQLANGQRCKARSGTTLHAPDNCTVVTCPFCSGRHNSDELCYECFPS